jgi:predicted choloylglycine hydrolase
MSDGVFNHYIFKGTPREVGRQHGEALKDSLKRHLSISYELARNISKIGKEKALETAATLKPYIDKYAPDFLEELKGMTEAAGISLNEAFLLQARQEIVYLSQYGNGGFECTSFAIGREYASDGKVYSGQNADLSGDFESVSNIITFAVEGKPQIMMLVPAGQISYLGMNSEGMSTNCNFLACEGWKKGYPRYLISRLMLEQRTFEDACQVLLSLDERASSRNILLADYKGNIADFETTADDCGRTDAEGMFVHSNHFIDPYMKRYEREDGPGLKDSKCRLDRLTELIRENKGRIDSDMIKSFLRDHKDGCYSLCMHAENSPGQYHTFASMIINLTDRVMEVAKGNPCRSEYKAYGFR